MSFLMCASGKLIYIHLPHDPNSEPFSFGSVDDPIVVQAYGMRVYRIIPGEQRQFIVKKYGPVMGAIREFFGLPRWRWTHGPYSESSTVHGANERSSEGSKGSYER